MKEYIKNFLEELNRSIKNVSWEEIAKAIKILQATREHDGKIFLVGNGGSAAIASHFANDLNKTVLGHKNGKNIKRFQAISLVDNTPLLTAWSNDVGYETALAEQLKNFAQEKDILFAISSSGNSPNIIKAAETAKNLHMDIIGLTGFDGGKLSRLADAKIHAPNNQYEIVESTHDSICHLLTMCLKEAFE